ncbi:MAG: hypothetical protein Ta2E_00880 [Mycoplasmoidaceae bacterium]|nr:MAG: hypothetical protein Ta2E_00880 [Mycoplasmoidaceae bacterium]
MRHILRNILDSHEFKEFVSNITKPSINKKIKQTKHKNRKTLKLINTFLETIDGNLLPAERHMFGDNIRRIFHRNIRKENAREFVINIRYSTSDQFKYLLERLLFGFLNVSKIGDSCVIKY